MLQLQHTRVDPGPSYEHPAIQRRRMRIQQQDIPRRGLGRDQLKLRRVLRHHHSCLAAIAVSSSTYNWCTMLFFILPVYERTETQEPGQSRTHVYCLLTGLAVYLALRMLLNWSLIFCVCSRYHTCSFVDWKTAFYTSFEKIDLEPDSNPWLFYLDYTLDTSLLIRSRIAY